ncbi:MAG: sigma-70 family RNA polymerase sigma factor [Mycobacteriaceae bacterium]|nr:sigma-70 family RNA polymerase sigma factor [Mycobacteriaceae bacterium]
MGTEQEGPRQRPGGDTHRNDDDDGRRLAFQRYAVPEIDILHRVARTLTRQPSDADDLVQETLLRAYRSVPDFDGRHPRAWLLTILRNADRNRRRDAKQELLDDPDEILELAVAELNTPETRFLDAALDPAIAHAVHRLPAAQAATLALVDLEGMSYAEAAAVLRVPVGTVMSRLSRARAWLRTQLNDLPHSS